MTTVLQKICTDKLAHIRVKKTQTPLADLQAQYKDLPVTRGFINALRGRQTALIAEVKKASPSKGIIRENFDAVEIAKIYEDNGASCLSVLTDEPYFMGHDDYLRAVREAVTLPLLRKDFMLDIYQVYEARVLGADCILLIMAALTDVQAKDLYDCATALDLDTLFEIHDEDELFRALALKPHMIGVNNRNLKTLEVSLETGLKLGRQMPDGIIKVAESGLETNADVARFKREGFNAFLVGESLMREEDIGAAMKNILGN